MSKSIESTINAETLTAKVVMIGNMLGMPAASLKHLKADVWHDEFMERLVYGIKTYILGSGEETVRCDYRWPADWVEAVKDRWLPLWIKDFLPVRYEVHRFEKTFYRAMCPHIDIPLHQGNEVHFTFLRDAETRNEQS